MEYRLWLTRTRRSVYSSALAKYKTGLAALLCIGVLAGVSLFLLKPASLTDLSQGHNAATAGLNLHWAKGDMIVLVRHVERCDHSTAPCLSGTDGITVRGKDVAQQVGLQFHTLGLERTDIYSSPVTRAAQTSTFMFNYASANEEWLSNCRQNIVRDALQHKVKDHNLILVTHSECISQFEKDIKLPASGTPGYGSALFVTVDENAPLPHALGFIDANDWSKVLRN